MNLQDLDNLKKQTEKIMKDVKPAFDKASKLMEKMAPKSSKRGHYNGKACTVTLSQSDALIIEFDTNGEGARNYKRFDI